MKKTITVLLAVLTFACLLAFGASAYEHEYFNIDVPSDYTVNEASDSVQFRKDDEVSITFGVKVGDDTDFYNMSEAERASWDDKVKSLYTSDGVISEYESSFDGDGATASAMGYSFTYSNPDDESDYVYVEGVIYSEGGVLYSVILMYVEDADYDEIEAIVESINFTPEGSSSENSVAANGIRYTSSDGALSLTIPAGFAETENVAPLDAMWMPENGEAYAIATLVTENTLHEVLIGLDAQEIEKVKNDVVTGSGNALQNAYAEQITINGMQGLRVYGDYVSGADEADMEAYMFSTYDTLYVVYFYDYGVDNADTYKRETINSLKISGELLVADEPTTQVPAEEITVPTVQPTAPAISGDTVSEPTEEAIIAPSDAEDKNEAETDSDDDSTTLYIVVGAVILIVLIAAIAIVIVSKNKKKPVPQYVPYNNPQNPPIDNYNGNSGFNQNNSNF